jgi:uncharacterized protein YjiS (DUF1127 family)
MPVVRRIERSWPRCFYGAMTFHVVRKFLSEWRRRARSRREIATLDYCTLRDLGLSAGQMRFEAQKPFWRA